MTRRTRGCGLLAGAIGLLAPITVFAEPSGHPHVMLAIDACPEVDPQEVRRIVGIELGALLTNEDGPFVTSAAVRCRDELVDVDVRDPMTGKSLTRSIDATGTTVKGRPRLVALAVAELVAASWTELEFNPRPRVPAIMRPPAPDEKEAVLAALRDHAPTESPTPRDRTPIEAREPTPRAPTPSESAKPKRNIRLLGVVAQRALFSDKGMMSLGVGGRVAYEGPARIGFSADVLADHASVEASIGQVAVDTVSSAPSLTVSQTWGAFSVQEALGLRLGVARVAGETPTPERVRADSLVSVWGGPAGGLAVRLRPASTLVIELAGEAGYVFLPVSAFVHGQREVSIGQLWLGAQLGVGVVL